MRRTLNRESPIELEIFSPGGNTTALVTTLVPRKNHAWIARRVMAKYQEVEQVGFIEPPGHQGAVVRLQMMGGEFCGNAARSAAMYWRRVSGQSDFVLEVSGMSQPVPAHVGRGHASIEMPRWLIRVDRHGRFPVVDMPGIRHMIIEGPPSRTMAARLCRQISRGVPAAGIMFVSRTVTGLLLTPFVWVRETKTLIRETACGTGTLAVAAVQKSANMNCSVAQPSRSHLRVRVKNNVFELSGPVQFVRRAHL